MVRLEGWTRPAFTAGWSGHPTFVGRARELSVIRQAWSAVAEGARQVVVLAGEPGAGKSRLAAHAAASLHESGAAILLGACASDLSRPYQPFVRPIETVLPAVRDEPPELDARGLRPPGHRNRLMVLAGRASDEISVPPSPERQRELYDAAVDALAAVAAEQPVVLVLEDMHWAGEAAVQLLTYVVEQSPGVRVLIVLTCRDTSPDRSGHLTRHLAQLRRLDGVHRLDLDGLETADIAEYLRNEGGAAIPMEPEVAAELRTRTGGNPFFLRELWRELVARGGAAALSSAETPVPRSVRDALQARLDAFGEEQRRILEYAAVAGDDIDVGAVSQAARVPVEQTLDTLDRAVAGSLVEHRPPVTFRFVHALARQAVLNLMLPSRLARMHARTAEIVESRPPLTDEQVRRLAHHYAQAHVLGYRDQAVRYLSEAAAIASRGLAHADAAALLEQAAGLTEQPGQRGELLLEATSRHMLAADYRRAYAVSEQVVAQAEGAALLRAAIALEEAAWWLGRPGQPVVDVLTRALSGRPHDHCYVRGLGCLARALAFSGAQQQAGQVSRQAIRFAEELGDDELLAHVLLTNPEIAGLTLVATAEAAEEQLRRMRSLWDLAVRAGDPRHLGPSAYLRGIKGYVYGSPDDVETALADLTYYARVSGQPILEQPVACMTYGRLFVRGQFAAAEKSSLQVSELGRRRGSANTAGPHGLQMFMLRRETGGLEQIRSLVTGQEDPAEHWAPGLLATYIELGRHSDAERLLRWILEERLAAYQEASSWPGVLAFLIEAATTIEDEASARRLRPMIADYTGCNLMSGGFDAMFGSAARYLGMLDSLVGGPDPRESFAAAEEMDRRMAAPLHQAHTLLARFHHAVRTGVRGQRAEALAEKVRVAARSVNSVRTLRSAGPPAAGAGPDRLTRREREVLSLLAQGLGNRQIAAQLFITENTAANHVRSILMKTGSANRTQAARYASTHGLE